jgi:hypothetical protein
MASKVMTKATTDGGRSVKFTPNNRDAIVEWLGDAYVFSRFGKVDLGKIRIKTPKGIRVAQVNDVIIKYGTRRNGGVPTFKVEKA